jgi:hypothetical protein
MLVSFARAAESAQLSTEKQGADSVLALWQVLPSLLWVLLAATGVWYFRTEIALLIDALEKRLRSGAAIKIGFLELSAIRVMIDESRPVLGESVSSFIEKEREPLRRKIYTDCRSIFIAHRLFPSAEPNQTYDIWIYAVAHKSDIHDIECVEYYLGEAWRHNVFVSTDQGKRFGILISAYGSGFLCLAKAHFKDGSSVDTWRYIDFEQGQLGKE